MPVLKARVGGAWVDVGGAAADEVFVGPTAPTDSATELWYDTSAASTPNKMPMGWVGGVIGSAAQSAIGGTITDLTGAAVIWTADATRRYKTTAILPRCVQSGVQGEHRFSIRDQSNVSLVGDTVTVPASSSTAHSLFVIQTGLSGSQTRKCSLLTMSGTCDTTAGFLPTIIVEDIGGV